MALRQVTVPYTNGYSYGVGADLASGSPMGKVVDGQPAPVPNAQGAITSFTITRIISTSDLETSLGIDVNASYGCGAFGAGVSARFNFAKNSKIQSSSLFLAVTAAVNLDFQSIDAPVLTAPATQLINRAEEFATRYGNMFVRGIARGGLFVGVIQIDTKSSEDSESISAELQGSYGLFSADAKTKFQQVQKDYHSEIHITVYHEGGPIDLALKDIQDPVELLNMLNAWLSSFQNQPEKNAVPYYVTLAPIAIADGPIPPNMADIEHAQDILVLCAKERSEILDNLNLLDYINQHSSQFDFIALTTPATLTAQLSGYQSDLDVVAACASNAINNVTSAVTPAEFASKTSHVYPKGSLPNPMPKSKPGVPQPIVIPNLVGQSIAAAYAWAQSQKISFDKFVEDDADQDLWQMLSMGYTDQDNIKEYNPHTDDQIIITQQTPAGGATLIPNASEITIRVGLAPGVAP